MPDQTTSCISGSSFEELKKKNVYERNYSPEMTTEYLLADDCAFFHLLYYLIMKEFQYVTGGKLSLEPLYIPHVGVDCFCHSDDLAHKRKYLLSRF